MLSKVPRWPVIVTLAQLSLSCVSAPSDRGDLFVHEPSGFSFPRVIGEFERGEVTTFDADGRDIGVPYSLRGHRVAVTVFVFPSPVLPGGTPVTLEQHFEAERAGVLESNPSARQIAWPNSFVTRNDEGVRAYHAAFELRGSPLDSATVTSLLQLFDYGSWRLKFRTTYRADDAEIPEQLEVFNRGFPWPQPSGRAHSGLVW